jgi:hypothetical protein
MATEPFESETAPVLREWDALNVLDTLTTRSEDALVVLHLVATNPDLGDHGTDAIASALLSIQQQLEDALHDMREAQEALWHHYRERRASTSSLSWPFASTLDVPTAKARPAAKKQQAKKPAAKPPAKVAAKKTKK